VTQRAIYTVSGASNDYRGYIVADDGNALGLVEQPWGRPLSAGWKVPCLMPFDEVGSLPDADFRSVYVPNLLVARPAPAKAVSTFEVELLPAMVGSQERYFLNFLRTLRRFRQEGADVEQVAGAILFIRKADFYAEDIPSEPRAFWFHDGNAPRFLLCNHEFKNVVATRGFSGLSFEHIGYAQ
jgi:hypothetical protein